MIAALLLAAASGVAGCYRAEDVDTASEIDLFADGRFRYALAAGALDERAEGRWTAADGRASLRTEPPPKPATFALRSAARAAGQALTVRVVWPDGRGIAGIDLDVGMDGGEPVTGYTQEDGWSLPASERRPPRWIELTLPMYGLHSQRFAIEAGSGNALTFVLTPNDLGRVDFAAVPVEIAPDGLVMRRWFGPVTYRKGRC